MHVLEGPRREIRRILLQGAPYWVSVEGTDLVVADGRRVPEAEAVYLPPVEPTKILSIHLNYDSRRIEFQRPALVTPTYYFQETVDHAERASRGAVSPGQYAIVQLRRRSGGRRRSTHAQCRAARCVGRIPAPRHSIGHQPTDSRAVRAIALGSDSRRR